MADWNWFFTGLAQSSAAIVGFLGGFVISKIIVRASDYERLRERSRNLLNHTSEQKRKLLRRYFDWYNNCIRDNIRESEEFKALVRKGTGKPNYKALIKDLRYSPFDSYESIVEEIDQYWGKKHEPETYGLYVSPNIGTIKAQANVHNQNMMLEEREQIDRELTTTETIALQISNHLADIYSFPKGSSITRLTLILVSMLFLIGVIYPLALTPTNGEPSLNSIIEITLSSIENIWTLRGLLLLAVTIIFIGIIIVFWILDASHSFPKNEVTELTKAKSVSSYSPYLNNYNQWLNND